MYDIETIRRAFVKTFEGSGEQWFSGEKTEYKECGRGESDDGTEGCWEEFEAHLRGEPVERHEN